MGKSTFLIKPWAEESSHCRRYAGGDPGPIYAEAEWNGVHFALIGYRRHRADSKDIIPVSDAEQADVAIGTVTMSFSSWWTEKEDIDRS